MLPSALVFGAIICAAFGLGYAVAARRLLAALTEQGVTRQALSENERQLAQIYDSALVGIVMFDEAGHYVRVNKTYCDMYGYAPEDLLGKTFLEILPPESHEIAMTLHRNYIEGSEQAVNEWQVKHASGKLIWINVEHSRVVMEDGRRYRVGVFLDITRRKEAELKLAEYAAELEQQNADLNAFSRMVAHDLKNPLSVIMGYALVLLDDYADSSIRDVSEYIEPIIETSQKMASIIDNMLLLSSLRRDEIMLTPVDMGAIVAAVQHRLQQEIETTHAEIIVADQWPLVHGHSPWIEQVWINYVSNALKYGGEPPRIELGADSAENGFVRFWVRDEGPGMCAADQKIVFTAFTRLGDLNKTSGHGLGLSIVKRIVEKLGGEVGVESVEGEGCTFSFTLPAEAPGETS